MYSFQLDYPTPLVPRELRFEVTERVTATGMSCGRWIWMNSMPL